MAVNFFTLRCTCNECRQPVFDPARETVESMQQMAERERDAGYTLKPMHPHFRQFCVGCGNAAANELAKQLQA